MISKSHPLANFLKVTGNIYATTLQRVKEDLSAGQKSIKLAKALFEPIAHTLRTEIS